MWDVRRNENENEKIHKIASVFFFAKPTTPTHNEDKLCPFYMKFLFKMHYIQLYNVQRPNNWCWSLRTDSNSLEKIFSFIFYIFLLRGWHPRVSSFEFGRTYVNVIGLRARCTYNRINGVHLRFDTSNITCCGMPFLCFSSLYAYLTYLWIESHKMDLLNFYFCPIPLRSTMTFDGDWRLSFRHLHLFLFFSFL